MSQISDPKMIPLKLHEDPLDQIIEDMPPPTSQPTKGLKRNVKKIILAEDEYVSKLSEIIERDYFPEISKLKSQLSLMEAYEKKDPVAIREMHLKFLGEQLKSRQQPVHRNSVPKFCEDEIHIQEETSKKHISVSQFFDQYTSEDNAAFEEIHARDLQEHRKKFNWAYESPHEAAKAGMMMLYHMGGKVLSVEDRKKFDALVDGPFQRGDERPNAPELWPFRVRNQLMFPPELEDSEKICSIDEQNTSNLGISCTTSALPSFDSASNYILALGAGDSGDGNSMRSLAIKLSRSKSENVRVGSIMKAQKEIQAQNTSLRGSHLDVRSSNRLGHPQRSVTQSPLEAPHTPTVMSDDFSDSSSNADDEARGGVGGTRGRRNGSDGTKEYALVPMTPLLLPDSAGFPPPMTFGEVCGAPICLDPVTSLDPVTVGVPISEATAADMAAEFFSSLNAVVGTVDSRFEIKPVPRRELLARALEVRSSNSTGHGSSFSTNSSSSSSNSQSGKRATESTPATYKLYSPAPSTLIPTPLRAGATTLPSTAPSTAHILSRKRKLKDGEIDKTVDIQSTTDGDESRADSEGIAAGDDDTASVCSVRTDRSRRSACSSASRMSRYSATSSSSSSVRKRYSVPQMSEAAKALAQRVYAAKIGAAVSGGSTFIPTAAAAAVGGHRAAASAAATVGIGVGATANGSSDPSVPSNISKASLGREVTDVAPFGCIPDLSLSYSSHSGKRAKRSSSSGSRPRHSSAYMDGEGFS